MQTYRIHRLKDHLRQQVRFAPHVSGTATVKPRDYQPADPRGEDLVEAETPYAAFFALRDTRAPLEVGDLLELPRTGPCASLSSWGSKKRNGLCPSRSRSRLARSQSSDEQAPALP